MAVLSTLVISAVAVYGAYTFYHYRSMSLDDMAPPPRRHGCTIAAPAAVDPSPAPAPAEEATAAALASAAAPAPAPTDVDEPTTTAPEPIIEPLAVPAPTEKPATSTSTSASASTDVAIEGSAASFLDALELVALPTASVAGVAEADADAAYVDVQAAAMKIANRGPIAPAATTAALSEQYAAQLGVWTDLTKPQRRSARKLLTSLLKANNGHALDFLRHEHEYDVVGVVARAILLHGSQEADRIVLREWYPEYARLAKFGKSADELSDYLVSD